MSCNFDSNSRAIIMDMINEYKERYYKKRRRRKITKKIIKIVTFGIAYRNIY